MRATTDGWGTLALTLGLLPLAGAQPPAPAGGGGQLIDTVEIVAGRDASTRVWENVYEVPVLDAAGRPTGETGERRSRFIELATGLNYDARTPEEIAAGAPVAWEPTVTEWETIDDPEAPLRVITGPLRVALGRTLGQLGHVQIAAGEKALRLSVDGLALYDTVSERLVLVARPMNTEPAVEGNRVIYRGAVPGGDIEYQYDREGFRQNLVIRTRGELPDPVALGMDPATTQIGLVSTLDLAGFPHEFAALPHRPATGLRAREEAPATPPRPIAQAMEGRISIEATSTAPFSFIGDDGRPLLQFMPGRAWDNRVPVRDVTPVRQRLLRHEGRTVLFDGVDIAWVRGASLPATIDYVAVPGHQSAHPRNMLFERGVTYHLSSTLVLYGGQTLVIEPGAIVKVGIGASAWGIDVHDGDLLYAVGRQTDPIWFTAANNSAIGETISSPAGYANAAINFWPITSDQSATSGTNTSIIQHCQFSNFSTAIAFYGPENFATNNIRHSVFRNNTWAIRHSHSSGTYASTISMLNCAIYQGDADSGYVNGTAGIVVNLASQRPLTLNLTNLTAHGTQLVTHLASSPWNTNPVSPEATVRITNSLLTSAETVLYRPTNFTNLHSSAGTLDLSGTSHIRARGFTSWDNYGGGNYGGSISALGANPYINGTGNAAPDSSAGEFYTASADDYASSPLRDAGGVTAESLGLHFMTIISPIEMAGEASGEWERQEFEDDGTVDIGFHSAVADYCVADADLLLDGDLEIHPGTRVAWISTASIDVDGGHGLRATGSAISPIECFSANTLNDILDDVTGSFSPYAGIQLWHDASPECEFSNIRFRHAGQAITVNGYDSATQTGNLLRLARPIEDCQFLGTPFDGATVSHGVRFFHAGGTVRNSLFMDCNTGVLMTAPAGESDLAVEGNTFLRCGSGLSLSQWPQSRLALVNEDNAFIGGSAGVEFVDADEASVEAVDRSNAWYANSVHAQIPSTEHHLASPESEDRHHVRANPLLTHVSSSPDASGHFQRLRWDADGFAHDDGVFLSQVDGDVSRWPYAVPTALEVTGILSPEPPEDGETRIWVGVAPPSTRPVVSDESSYMAQLVNGNFYQGAQEATPGVNRLWILLEYESEPELTWDLGSQPLTLEFGNGDNLTTHLPAGLEIISFDLKTRSVGFWVALDGSLYHGSADHPLSVDSGFDPFSQDNGFALAVDVEGLAQSVREITEESSPLVDAGSRDLWNWGYTARAVPPGYPHQDNPSTGANPAVPHGRNPEDILDIGYHYFGHLRPVQGTMAAVHDDFWGPSADLVLDLGEGSGEVVALVSRALDGDFDRDGETVAYIQGMEYDIDGDPEEGQASPVIVWDFEESPEPQVATFSGHESIISRLRQCPYEYSVGNNAASGIQHITAAAVVSAEAREGDPELSHVGITYLATVMHWNPGGSTDFDELYVWRTANGIDFQLIGARLHVNPVPLGDMTTWSPHDTRIAGAALAANNDDLWVFWTEAASYPEEGAVPSGLYGVRIPNAATRETGAFLNSAEGVTSSVHNFSNDGPGSEAVTEPFDLPGEFAPDIIHSRTLDAEFDFAYDGDDDPVTEQQFDGLPHIIYINESGDAVTARVALNHLGQPSGLTEIEILPDLGVDEGNMAFSDSTALTVDHTADVGQLTPRIHAGYAHRSFVDSAENASYEGAWIHQAISTGSADAWSAGVQIPSLIDEPRNNEERRSTRMTWRFSGRPRTMIVTQSGAPFPITTNQEVLTTNGAGAVGALGMATNAANLTDIWVAYQNYTTGQDLVILRLDP